MNYMSILGLLLGSAIFLEWRYHVHLYRNRRERFLMILLFFGIGVIWDSYAIYSGHWSFPKEGTLGITVGMMPLEEYLFILILPFWLITTYKVFHEKIKVR